MLRFSGEINGGVSHFDSPLILRRFFFVRQRERRLGLLRFGADLPISPTIRQALAADAINNLAETSLVINA